MMKDYFTNMETGISYKRHGDYYFLDMALPPQKGVQLNRYGRARLRYLKEHKRVLYVNLLTSGKLNEHLSEIQDKALGRFDEVVENMKAVRGITEELKAQDQMAWVGAMNNIRNCAEEIVLREIIYC
jgi:hypothetical protein